MGILKFIAFCAQIDFFGLRASTLWEPESWYVCITMVDYKIHFQKCQLWRSPKRRSFSCRKTGVACRDLHSIRFWGSNPSCLCATHVAIKICCYFGRFDQVEDWIVLKDAISWEMTTDAFWYACLFAGKCFAMQLWQQNFCKFCTIFGPQNGGWKWTQKWCHLIPKMGSKNGTQRETQYFK